MKNILTLLSLAILLTACGGSPEAETEKAPELKTFKEKISYAMGADHAGQLVNANDPNFEKYDKAKIIEGFSVGLKDEDSFGPECQKTIENLVGPSMKEFNPAYVEEGSLCIGKVMGSVFVKGWREKNAYDQFDIEKVKYGFGKALYKTDTLIEKSQRAKMVQDFIMDVTNKAMAKVMQAEAPFFEKIKAMKGIETLPDGMYLETIKAGKGAKPAPGDDVLVDYILTNIKGDTIESSFDAKKMGRDMPAFSLNGVIRGWSVGVPFMKKGGTYRLYVPTQMAYGKEPLVFYIELKDFGKPGSLVKQQPMGM